MSKENLVELILNNYNEFASIHDQDNNIDLSEVDFCEANLLNVKFIDCDLTGADFSRAQVSECDFSGSILNGASFNYATVNFCEFLDADMAGVNFSETDLTDSDLSTSENLDSCRFDESTVWPELDKLPEDFDSTYNYDLSTLRDDEEGGSEDY